MTRPHKYFVAKHDLASFLAWPRVIWRTGEREFPPELKKIHVGDRWMAFAYIKDEDKRDRAQQVVGFYECTFVPTKRDEIPPKPRSLTKNDKLAWAIKGKVIGSRLLFPVTVPSINKLLQRRVFNQQTLTPVSKEEFDRLYRQVRSLRLDPKRIPLISRDPRCEQEVVAILVAAHKKLGIEKIDRVQTKFPDLRVKLVGKRGLIHLEVETYSSSFRLHGHQNRVQGRVLDTKDISEKLPVAVVCWNHDDKGRELAACVHKVYELQGLLQRKGKIRWGR